MASASHRCGHLLNRRDDAFGLAPPNCFPSTSTSVARTGIQPASTAPGTPGCSPPRTPYSTRCDAVATERPACMAAYNAALTDAKTVKRLTTNTPPPPSLAPPGPQTQITPSPAFRTRLARSTSRRPAPSAMPSSTRSSASRFGRWLLSLNFNVSSPLTHPSVSSGDMPGDWVRRSVDTTVC